MKTVADQAQLIAYARATSDQLKANGGNIGLATSAVEFLRRHGGVDSSFYDAAATNSKSVSLGDTTAAFYAGRRLGELLLGWADFAETGLASSPPFALAARKEAANDLMEQAELLLADGAVHPAVSVMIAGAAVEELLRGLWTTSAEPLKGQPGIVAYGEALRKATILDKHAVKDLISIADQRNIAAHGHFDKVSAEVARIFVARANLFISQNRSAAEA